MTAALQEKLKTHLGEHIESLNAAHGEVVVEIKRDSWLDAAVLLRDHDDFKFEILLDVAGVDYLTYGLDEWQTESASGSGFERGRAPKKPGDNWQKPRFSVVYQLLSVTLNQRLTVRVFVDEETLRIPSVIDVWNSANWYEREAFDLYGILFEGHPDLRRILTDYGFIGHPFRKDFPVIGELELRYDEERKQCVYEPVSIEERINVARVIRRNPAA